MGDGGGRSRSGLRGNSVDGGRQFGGSFGSAADIMREPTDNRQQFTLQNLNLTMQNLNASILKANQRRVDYTMLPTDLKKQLVILERKLEDRFDKLHIARKRLEEIADLENRETLQASPIDS